MSQPGKDHIPALDGLRGIACLVIFIGHFITWNKEDLPAWMFAARSQFWSGVDLFFVLSGFVIFLSLIRLSERGHSLAAVLRIYFTSRIFRILPVYLLFLSVGFLVMPLWKPSLATDSLFFTAIPHYVYLFFGQTWYMCIFLKNGAQFANPTWSLCAEVYLYIVSFLIVALVPRRRWLATMVGAIGVSYLARLYVVLFTRNPLVALLFPVCRMDGFMMGGVVAVLYTGLGRIPMSTRALNRILLPMFGVFGILCVMGNPPETTFAILFSYLFYSLFYCLILVRVIAGHSMPVLSRGLLPGVGIISYFVYLFHFSIVCWVWRYSNNQHYDIVVNFAKTTLLVFVPALASWFLMERPLIGFGKHLNRLAGAGRAPA